MLPDLTTLCPADHALLARLEPAARKETHRRLAAIQQVAAAPKGTKNTVMTKLADQLGVTIGGVNSFCMNYRKGGLAAILPRDAMKKSTIKQRPSLIRQTA